MGSLTLIPSKVPLGYFSDENIKCISDTATKILKKNFIIIN